MEKEEELSSEGRDFVRESDEERPGRCFIIIIIALSS
jgi:hypothetical protein